MAPRWSSSTACACSPTRCCATASRTCGGACRRRPPAALRDLDAVLISHLHRDHLDLPSLRRVGARRPDRRPARRRAPAAAARLRRRARGRARATRSTIGALTVRATEARHHGGRGVVGAHGPALGFVIAGHAAHLPRGRHRPLRRHARDRRERARSRARADLGLGLAARPRSPRSAARRPGARAAAARAGPCRSTGAPTPSARPRAARRATCARRSRRSSRPRASSRRTSRSCRSSPASRSSSEAQSPSDAVVEVAAVELGVGRASARPSHRPRAPRGRAR